MRRFGKFVSANGLDAALEGHSIDPQGAEFVYNGVQAVRYGTWHDVAKCLDVPLPGKLAKNHQG